MNIAIDLDGVLANSEKIYIKLANKLYNKTLKHSDYKEWDYLDKVIGEQNARNVYSLTWKYYKQIEPSEPNLPVKIRKLKQFGKVYLLTKRISTFEMPYIIKWLEKHNINIFDGYIFLLNESKEALNSFFNCYVDDASFYAQRIINDTKNYSYVFIYDRPWNQDIRNYRYDNLIRVFSLDNVIEHLSVMYYDRS